jgi:hypothetical protein
MDTLEKRQLDLKRQSYVADVEAACMNLDVNSSKTFQLMDLQACQSIRTRFHRLKLKTGVVYDTVIEGNNIIVTRKNNEENNRLPDTANN